MSQMFNIYTIFEYIIVQTSTTAFSLHIQCIQFQKPVLKLANYVNLKLSIRPNIRFLRRIYNYGSAPPSLEA